MDLCEGGEERMDSTIIENGTFNTRLSVINLCCIVSTISGGVSFSESKLLYVAASICSLLNEASNALPTYKYLPEGRNGDVCSTTRCGRHCTLDLPLSHYCLHFLHTASRCGKRKLEAWEEDFKLTCACSALQN